MIRRKGVRRRVEVAERHQADEIRICQRRHRERRLGATGAQVAQRVRAGRAALRLRHAHLSQLFAHGLVVLGERHGSTQYTGAQ
ncbi:MAG: hypothetical protein A2637_03490 [Candidatus Muproteobacteria bacterium RIFCSPHIGHO2_01_FULL_65_16]|uniref:Uncharacterized protein n=1 Tax=Candidatus Muproteobacteria bacterium RIFCSPHIGHO2_01_FULL_65_16 TaxID=1817764 RepID=A0A1F6TH11_9PROT|nr:MAG: hypothetical protein A2637_03490 [Candidatus Muproteobacteria bacterium RIFCSPHIGHO2_01_FULL_65_16]